MNSRNGIVPGYSANNPKEINWFVLLEWVSEWVSLDDVEEKEQKK